MNEFKPILSDSPQETLLEFKNNLKIKCDQ